MFQIGSLVDGIAMSGDGQDLEEPAREFKVALYDPDRIDRTSLDADYLSPVRAGKRTALFLTWRTPHSNGVTEACGVDVIYHAADGFQFGSVRTSKEAIEFMSDTQMMPSGGPQVFTRTTSNASVHFAELSVSGYRGFAQERHIRFAEPTGRPGSGLTVIVGANNSGKSTFLEALHSIARARTQTELSFPQPRRHQETDSVAIEIVRSDGRSLRIETIKTGGSQANAIWSPEEAGPAKFDIQVTPSRRQFSPYFGISGVGDRNWGLMDQEFSRTQLRENFVSRLRKVDRDPDARSVFDDLLRKINGKKLDWTIDEITTSQQFLKLVEPDGTWHTSEGLGDGLVSLLFIVDALYDSSPGCLIAIDEPELSLHPQLVRRLGRVLSEYASNRQIVVATHSPMILDWADVANGATVARVYKENGKSEIAQASDEILRKVAKLAGSHNLSNPHTVGTVAQEAFFLEDGIILTEGQDDVVYLPRVLEDLELDSAENIYGWGSGGATNIPTLAQLFIELGFSKIGAILDSDGEQGTIDAISKLESMAPQVSVCQIPARDIRYKKAIPAKPAVEGLLGQDGHVMESLRDSARTVLKSLLDHVTADSD